MEKATFNTDTVNKEQNLSLWNAVCRTNPNDTTPVQKGKRSFTAICSQSQFKAATEYFGPYGSAWGLKNITRDFESMRAYEIAIFSGVFFYPGGEFEISTSVSVWFSKPKGILDNDICKKSETDLVTKALSKIGFNADVFMGLFDDNRYVQEMREEFNKPKTLTRDQIEQVESFLSAKGIDKNTMLSDWSVSSLAEIHDYNFQPAMDWIESQPANTEQQPQPVQQNKRSPQELQQLQDMAQQVVNRTQQKDRQQAAQQRAIQAKQERNNTRPKPVHQSLEVYSDRAMTHTRMEDGPTSADDYQYMAEQNGWTGENVTRETIQPIVQRVITPAQVKQIRNGFRMSGLEEWEFLEKAQIRNIGQLTQDRLPDAMQWLKNQAHRLQGTVAH